MQQQYLTEGQMRCYEQHLRQKGCAAGSIKKYSRDIRRFVSWLEEGVLHPSSANQWRDSLLQEEYAPCTVNSMVVAVNGFLKFLGHQEYCAKELKIQRRLFRSAERQLDKEEYLRLLHAARSLGKERTALLLETICATGIRVSEVRYITVKAIQCGRVDIHLKGKVRTILIPNQLCRKLQKYARKQKITSGEVFLTKSGNGISRQQIWAEMKALCTKAGVLPSKVFPHNLRHLFARVFYRSCRDVTQLADILGHSSIETTRIYLIATGAEHARRMNRLGLVV